MRDRVDSPAAGRSGPIRTCVGCRHRAAQAALLRVVAVDSPSGTILRTDGPRLQPGRGAYLHPTLGCLELAERRRALPRALRLSGTFDLGLIRRAFSAGASETSSSK